MNIIGIIGGKGHGKDACGVIFKKNGYKSIAFATALKEAAKIIFSFSNEQVYGDIKTKETIDKRYGVSPRFILQKLGMWARAIYPNIWVDNTFKAIDEMDFVDGDSPGIIITDTRFKNEAQVIRDRGGIIIKVERPGAGSGKFEEHVSEQERFEITPDYIIMNDGTLDDLKNKVNLFMEEYASDI